MCRSDRLFHPFSVREWTSGQPGKFLWGNIVDRRVRKLPGGFTEDYYRPKLNPTSLRWVHMDLALSADSAAFAIGHVDKMVEVTRRNEDGEEYTDIQPHIVMDLMLRVNPPNGEQIILADIRGFVYQLQAKGYQFVGASCDSFQSADTLQQLKHRGINTKVISVDRTTDAYDNLRAAMYEGRLEIYEYDPFESELMALEYDPEKGKIDHPIAGSKDCSDAVAGVVQGLTEVARKLPVPAPGPEMMPSEMKDHSWVNPNGLIPVGEDFDIDQIRSEYDRDEDFGESDLLFPLT